MGLKIAAILLVVLMAASGGFYWYYQDTQKRIAILHENNAKLELSVETQKATLKQQAKDIALAHDLATETQKKFEESRQQVEDLRGKFNKVSKLLGQRDIGKLAVVKPRPIARIITKGTVDSLRCFELLSGATHTEKELQAEKPSQINKACPAVANPNYLGN
jgi:hypothetical protein